MLADIPAGEAVSDVVMTGAWAVSGRWREDYDDVDRVRATMLLDQWGMGHLGRRTFGTLSEGERKRALIARALMSDPELVLLDEPGAGLDLGGREDLVDRMGALARDPDAPAQIVVTHHVEEIPAGFTHLLLMRGGRTVASGDLMSTMTDENLSAAFGMRILVHRDGDRWFARRAG
jgi:iron complex transport system ATP-binding protein